MNTRKLIYMLIAAASFLCNGCVEESNPESKGYEFVVRVSESAYNYAIVNVRHNGPEDITWYGFMTEDTQRNVFDQFFDKYTELAMSGNRIEGLKKTNDRNILLEGLKENQKYRYIVFAIDENGELNKDLPVGSIDFSTSKNVFLLNETDNYEIKYNRDAARNKELIEIKPKKGGRFGWSYVSKETIDKWNEKYPDGFEHWDGQVYMATVDGIKQHILEEISTIQYQIFYGGYKVEEVTYVYQENAPFELDRMASGDYYIIAFGFDGEGQHTQEYTCVKISIKEEEATEEYNRWLGKYRFTGKVESTDEFDNAVDVDLEYCINIEKADNNHMYKISGWECRTPEGWNNEHSVDKDWEEDIMGFEKGDGKRLYFPAYFNNGALEIRESPLLENSSITFDGNTVLTLGIYGYAYNDTHKTVIPVILDNTLMAKAEPIADGEQSTTLEAQTGKYTAPNGVVTQWTYAKMGYTAWDRMTGSYQALNGAMKFPITITRITE